MVSNKNEKIFGSINRQFLLYFLLFSYIPLMIFSIIGFFINRSTLYDIERDYLLEINRSELFKIKELFAYNDKTAGSPLKQIRNKSSIDFKEQISQISGWNETVLQEGKNQLPQSNYNLNEQFKKNGKYIFDWRKRKVYQKKVIDTRRAIYFPIDLSEIKKIIKTDNPNYYSELVYKNGDVYAVISDSGLSKNRNFVNRFEKYLQRTSALDKNWYLTTYRSTYSLNKKLNIFLSDIFIANLVIGILLFIAAFFLANKIVTPIRLLAEAAEKISRGELCDKVNDGSKNELKTMGDQFDAMRFKLKAAYANLERKIEERTKALQEAQFQVSHQEKMASLGLMAAGVAHEIGNPLTSISSLTQIIKRKIDDPQQLKYADTILENIERISVIVHELVDFARPTCYRALMSDVNEIIRNAVNIVRYDRRAKQIDIGLELQVDLPPVHLVADQLLQVFINILINAVDALGENDGQVSVRSYSRDENVYILFKDSGAGIKDESIAKIFQPFFTTKEVGKGTGLGLSVSYGIIKNLNGDIDVKSKLGEGSEFTVRIPIDQSCGKKRANN